MATQAYIFDAVRTPRSKGRSDGSLHEVKSIELGAGLLRELQKRYDLDTSYVDDVMLGCTGPIKEQGGDIAKSIVQFAGWDESVAGVQMDRFCASGLEAVNSAAQNIMSGWNQLIVAGGVESMSRVPMGAAGASMMFDPEFVMTQRTPPQGIGADLIATLGGWTRNDVDNYALLSQKRAAYARDNGYFDRSVVPVRDANGLMILAKDDFIRSDATLEGLASLKPSFKKNRRIGNGRHTIVEVSACRAN